MDIKIALAGNPNCGKTTLFNSLTGMNQYVGNWPGVTVEKKEGALSYHNHTFKLIRIIIPVKKSVGIHVITLLTQVFFKIFLSFVSTDDYNISHKSTSSPITNVCFFEKMVI